MISPKSELNKMVDGVCIIMNNDFLNNIEIKEIKILIITLQKMLIIAYVLERTIHLSFVEIDLLKT
jgi:DNA-binding protein